MISVPFQVFQLLISLVILNNQKSPYLYLLAPQNIVTFTFYYLPVRKFSSIAFGNYQR